MTLADHFKPMLAGKLPTKTENGRQTLDLSKLRFPLRMDVKLDGIRGCVVNGRLVSRTLKAIPNREISGYLSRPEYEGLDGELIVGDPTAPDCCNRTSSYVSSPDKTGEPWCYYVFDRWNSTAGYLERRATLESVESDRVVIVSSVQVDDMEQLEAIETALIAAGYEGAILRDPNGLYKYGRGTATKGDLIKLKRFSDFEAEIVGCQEELHNGNVAERNELGRTKRSTHQANKHGKGSLGAFECVALNGVHEGQRFFVGTGFSQAQREAFWRGGRGMLGQAIKVKSFPVGFLNAPRFPVFLGFRDMSLDG